MLRNNHGSDLEGVLQSRKRAYLLLRRRQAERTHADRSSRWTETGADRTLHVGIGDPDDSFCQPRRGEPKLVSEAPGMFRGAFAVELHAATRKYFGSDAGLEPADSHR